MKQLLLKVVLGLLGEVAEANPKLRGLKPAQASLSIVADMLVAEANPKLRGLKQPNVVLYEL